MLTRHVQRTGFVLGAILAALLFFMGGAALRLLMGPISLGPFAGIIEDALNHSVSGVVIRFDQAVLEWSRPEGRVNLIVLGTKVFDLNGHIIAQAPKADLDFDAASLVQGHLSLKRFGLIGVQLTGVRSKEGAVRLGFGAAQDEPDLLETIRNILQNSAEGGGTLDSFSIRNARLAFRDEPTGLFIISPDATFTLENKAKELDASLEAAVEISGVPARISATSVIRPDGTPERGTVAIKGLSFPALTRNNPNFAALVPYRLVSDLTATYTLKENGDINTVAFHATGSGSIETFAIKVPLSLQKFATDGSYDSASNNIVLDSFSFTGPQAAASGKATIALDKEWALESVAADFTASNLQLSMVDWFSQPLVLSRLSVQAMYDHKNRKVTWQRAIIEGGALAADFSGTTQFADSGSPELTFTGTMNPLTVAEALKYWPRNVGEGARDWIAANIPEGRVGPIRIDANLPAGAFEASALPDESLALSFPFEGMTTHYVAGMTPITGAHGEAKLTGDHFQATVAAGSIGPIALSGGDVVIPDLHSRGVLTRIKAHAEGKMSEILQLIDQEPLGYPKRFGINAATVEGRGAADLDFELPLLKDLALEQIRIGVQAKATDLALPIDGRKFEHGMVSFTIDSKSLLSQGTATLTGVPVAFKWTEDFAAPGITTRIDLSGKLDEATRPNFGLAEPKWLTGPIPVTLSLTGRRFHFAEASVKADLTNAAADLPTINIAKRSGVRSAATAQLHFGDAGAISVSDMVISGDGLNARGGMAFDGSGALLNVSLSSLRSGINDFAINVQPLAGGGLAYRIDGKTLDASHFFADKKKTPNAPPPGEMDDELQNPLSVNAKLERLVFQDELGFRDVTLAVSFGGNEKLTGFSLDAMGTGKGKVTGRMSVVNGARNLDLNTDDAGAFIDTFMGFSSVRGGKLGAKITFPIDAPNAAASKTQLPDYQGTITLASILITDQPFFARLFSAGSLDGPLRLLQGQGISLTTVSVPFNARGKLVTIREGRAAGPAIGATFSGSLDRKAERIDLAGSLVPVYGLNSMLGWVPILGDILASRKGEGIIGLTYAMKGNLNEPVVSVNPLSVLTPGIFRRIFEFDPPKEILLPAPAPQASAVPAPGPATPQ